MRMAEHWVGIVASGPGVIVVAADIPAEDDRPIVITYDQSWPTQRGSRPAAYAVLHQQCINLLQGRKIDRVFIRASATSRAGMGKAHLDGAEVRGVVAAAAASICPVELLPQAQISKTYGDRKVEEYVKDNEFWAEKTTGGRLRSGSRIAAMLLLAARAK
jgi:hypothetical protein